MFMDILNDLEKQGWLPNEEYYDDFVIFKNDNIKDFNIVIRLNDITQSIDYLVVESTVLDNEKRFKNRQGIDDTYFYNDFERLKYKIELIMQTIEIIKKKVVLPLCIKYDLTYKSDARTWDDYNPMMLTGDIETFIIEQRG